MNKAAPSGRLTPSVIEAGFCMIRTVFCLAVALAFSTGACAQDYPTKPIRLIVPNPAGGGNDVIARIIATELGMRLGKQVVVDNRGGAAGVIGTEAVATAAGDGYTLLVASSNHVTNPWLYKINYDPVASVAPVAMLATVPAALVVHPGVPAKSVQEFIALAKAKPGQLDAAHGGTGGFQHLSWVLFAKTTGIDVVEVPYKGGGPAMIGVMGGHAHINISSIVQARAHFGSGKLRPIGTTSAKRSALLPDLPTVAEQGVAGYTAANWVGILAPASTPKSVIERLHKELTNALGSPRTSKQLETEGAEPAPMTTAEFGSFLEAELGKWQQVIKSSGIKTE